LNALTETLDATHRDAIESTSTYSTSVVVVVHDERVAT